ncbi:cyclin domain-containing protein [Ophiostoma piceae UAMH 11346]|uniref:Cyclin domain-containing protein n=1 Tax=Ophiostoma piceae (strain UAMH 11346) TaxID=1262450 RepID=S3C7T4_OPHP1|nr:cyclin domain-containing protein [Ophiostoma piceae UAMH 11346]
MSHLTNPLATAAQLTRCRDRSSLVVSGKPDADSDFLDAVFFAVQRLTQAAGLLLELPQSTTARANVLLARYWVQDPGFEVDLRGKKGPSYRHVSAAAVYLVAKTGPVPRSARDVANVYHYLAVADAADAQDTASSDTEYNNFHTHVLACEARLLTALAFETHVALPHPLAVTFLQALGFLGQPSPKSSLSARMVSYLNTALLSPQLLYVTHQPHELAVAALYNAACDLGLQSRLPSAAGPWWEVFDVDRETLGFLAVALRSVTAWAASTTLPPLGLSRLSIE